MIENFIEVSKARAEMENARILFFKLPALCAGRKKRIYLTDVFYSQLQLF